MLRFHSAISSAAAKDDQPLPRDNFFGPDGDEVMRQRKERIRNRLRLASRSEADLGLLLDLASEACSFQALAAAAGKPRQTVSRWVARAHEALRHEYIRMVARAALQEYQ
ncbi:MAG: hypothetical protein ACRC33_12680, partial [Gemmataceae bacterium]